MSRQPQSDAFNEQNLVTVKTLGAWEVVSTHDGAVALAKQPVRLALLTIGALERRVDRSRLLDMLWPEHPVDAARHTLSQTLYLIRQVVGPGILESDGPWIVASERLHCDALKLQRAVEDGDVLRALTVYEGRFMPALARGPTREFERWADLWSSTISRAARVARLGAIDEYKRSGRYQSALELARSWVREDEYQDEAQHALIELLFLNGHPSDAIRQFDSYREAIRRDLAVEPLPETVALVARIRAESPPLKPIGATPKAVDAHDDADSVSSGMNRLGASAILALTLIFLVYAALAMSSQPARDPNRVAVLTFDDLSAGRTLGIASRGLTRGVIHHLSTVDQIDVVPYHTLPRVDGGTLLPDSILDVLGVGTVVVGSLQEERDRLIATVQMIDAERDRYVGSHRIDVPRDELPSLNDRLAQSVARLLRQHLGRTLRFERRLATASSAESWMAVNRAHDLAERLWAAHGQIPEQLVPEAPDVLAEADSMLERASDIDPDWPEPLVLRARVALARAKLQGRGEDPSDYEGAVREGLKWADSAAALAPNVPGTTGLRGILLHQLAWTILASDPDSATVLTASSDSALQAAIRLDATNAETWLALSELRRRKGDLAGSRAAAIRALEEDAYLTNAERVYQLLFVNALEIGAADEALEWIEEAADLFPYDPRFFTGRLTLSTWTGEHALRPDSIFAILRYLDSIDPPTNAGLEREYQRVHRVAMAAGALARAGANQAAREMIDSLALAVRDVGAWRGPFGWDEAQVRLLLGDTLAAVEGLGTWLNLYPTGEPYLVRSRIFRDLTSQPHWMGSVRQHAQEADRQ